MGYIYSQNRKLKKHKKVHHLNEGAKLK